MKYEEFTSQIRDSIEEYVGETAVVSESTVLKNNDVRLHGISIMPREGNASSTIYLRGYFAEYERGRQISDIMLEIIRQYEESRVHTIVKLDFFSDYEEVRKRVLYKLVSYDKNEELLKEIPHVRYLDLAIVFYCMLMHDEIGSATILIYNKHMELWNASVEDICRAAKENTRRLLGCQIEGLEDIMKEMLAGSLREGLRQECEAAGIPYPKEDHITEFAEYMLRRMTGTEDRLPMYVLSNKEKMNGAGCLLYGDVLAELADELHQDLFILPSSIHEVILVPTEAQGDHERLTQIVQEVNATQVEADEILADHVYYFSRNRRKVICM